MNADTDTLPSEMQNTLCAVVALRSTVPDDAFTAEVLGTERAGYGAIIRSSGLILTVGYLTAEAETIWIKMADGRTFQGHVLAYDYETGFGLVQILARVELPTLVLGKSENAAIGDQVIIAGSGEGSQTLIARIVARQEFAGYWEYALDDALFTAPAHPNWGGTAVIDQAGELIGIGSLLVQELGGHSETGGMNMVVPIDILKPRLDRLLKTGRSSEIPRPWLGLFAAETPNGVVIINVASYGPAAESEVSRGDVVLAVNGDEIEGLGAFFKQVWALGPAGVNVPLLVSRDGQTMEINIRSADRHSFLKTPTAH